MSSRSSQIVAASMVNIAGNVVLSALKLTIGLICNSIAITLDAVNNLTDTLSSIVTIGGTKIAERRANSKHPFGYGRFDAVADFEQKDPEALRRELVAECEAALPD